MTPRRLDPSSTRPSQIYEADKRHVTFRPVPIACAKCHAGNPGIDDTTKSSPRGGSPSPGAP